MELQQILEQLELNTNQEKRFNSFFYQPERLIFSSEDATTKTYNYNKTAFNNLSFLLKKPCNSVKSIQLLHVNIPSTTALSFNDYELVFFYYRLRTQRNFDDTKTIYNELPSLDNLYMVRLLPSYYPQNIIPNSQNYGFNKTFNNYQELSDELAKACANDLAYTNFQDLSGNFYPNDITIRYNEELNKFEMIGNNVYNRVRGGSPPDYGGALPYYTNDIVAFAGNFYIAVDNSQGITPGTDPTKWAIYVSFDDANTKIWNTYLIAGYNDPNVKLLMGNTFDYTFPTWNDSTKYMSGTRITFTNGGITRTYRANIDNTNCAPNDYPDMWEDLGTSPFTVIGINETSNLFDFKYTQYNLNNIIDIPPQPYFNGSTYTLNRRLGFNWSGEFTWPRQTNVIGYEFGDDLPILYNRLRPVPEYELIPPLAETPEPTIPIPNNNPYTSNTYIADGFCNLVLTSIIYLYGNFIGTSTYSSSSTENIIAVLAINSGSLGISFTTEALENPLTKVNNTIQDIQIEFRNEHNQPLYFGNNGIITFSFKIIY